MTYLIIWQYTVADEHRQAFETAYYGEGAWAQLFRRSSVYLKTELWRNDEHYITLDYWTNAEDYHAFLEQYQDEYQALDQQFESLTMEEMLIGKFKSIM